MYMYTELYYMYILTVAIRLLVQALATFLAIFTTSSLSLAIIRAVWMNSFFDVTSPSSPLKREEGRGREERERETMITCQIMIVHVHV